MTGLKERLSELDGMRGALKHHRTTPEQAKEDLAKLFQAEVSKGNVTMKQLGDQLTLGPATKRRRPPEKPARRGRGQGMTQPSVASTVASALPRR